MLAAVERNLTPMGTDQAPIFETKTTVDRREETRIKGGGYWRVRIPVKPTKALFPSLSLMVPRLVTVICVAVGLV
jgi:hypothetical protein